MTWTRRGVLGLLGETGVATMFGGGMLDAPDGGRHVVGTDRGATDVARRAASGISAVLDFGAIGSAVVGEWAREDLGALRKHRAIRYVEPEATLEAAGQRTPCGVERIGADHVREEGTTGAGTDVVIVDSGIDPDHDDLRGNLGEGAAWEDCTDDGCGTTWDDEYGHGTAIAGIVGAAHDSGGVVGVAPDTTLHAAKVLGEDGTGSSSDVADAIRWTADRGYDVANLSMGSTGSTEVIGDAVRYASERGVLVVGAAGNRGPCSECVMYPAAHEEVVAVSAVDCNGEWESYSSQGDAIELTGVTGVTTTDADGGDRYSTGTSAAAPHVSGVGALLMATGSTAAEARTRMQDTSEDLGLSADRQGNGLVNADRAVLGTDYDDSRGDDSGGDGGGGDGGDSSGDGGGSGGDGSGGDGDGSGGDGGGSGGDGGSNDDGSGDGNDGGDDDSDDLLWDGQVDSAWGGVRR